MSPATPQLDRRAAEVERLTRAYGQEIFARVEEMRPCSWNQARSRSSSPRA